MLWLITTMIAVSLAGGGYVASLHRRNEPPRKKIALVHGVIGITAALLLAGLMILQQDYTLLPAVGTFVVVIFGGTYLFSFRSKTSPAPGSAIAIHGVLALLAFGLLIYTGFLR